MSNLILKTTVIELDLQILVHYTNGSKHVYTLYEHFVVDGVEDKFTLHIGQLQQPSPGCDGMVYHNGQPFTTYNKDNDSWGSNCAAGGGRGQGQGGGWWYGDCAKSCLTQPHPSIYWLGMGIINYVEMEVRSKQCVLQ